MKKDVILFVSIFVVLLLISGGTYAYWSWISGGNKIVGFNTASGIEDYIVYNPGSSHFVGNFQPSENFCNDTVYNTLSFYKQDVAGQLASSEMMMVASIKMDVNAIGANIKTSDYVHWVVIKGTSCTAGDINNALASGTFKGVNAGTTITLVDNLFVPATEVSYTVYIWIDSSGSNSSLTGETIDVNVWTQIDQIAAWYGDINFDGKVNALDYALIKEYVDGIENVMTPQKLKNADVNADGVVDATDYDLTRGYVMETACVGYLPITPCIG